MTTGPTTDDDTGEDYDYDVIVIGAGISGVSAVYHLLQEGIEFPSSSKDRDGRKILIVDAGRAPGEGLDDRKSGTATMKNRTTTMSKIKMITQLFAADAAEFVKHHGHAGARTYCEATKVGIEIQTSLAKSLDKPRRRSDGHIVTDDDVPVVDEEEDDEKKDCDREATGSILTQLGSYYVCPMHQRDDLKVEYDFFKSLGDCFEDIEFIDGSSDAMRKVPGASPDFPCAIYFPRDAVVDSSEYTKRLLEVCMAKGNVTLQCNTRVSRIIETATTTSTGKRRASIVIEQDGSESTSTTTTTTISARHGVVVATGGMDPFPELNGILMPCYSYLASVPIDGDVPEYATLNESPNFFTYGYTHDWCFTAGGQVRVSGEDHYNAYKPPQADERNGRMIDWTRERYRCPPINDRSSVTQQYGIYSETPDHIPLVGTLHDTSSVCYLLGCNAWGQAVLSYCATLIPGVLGCVQRDTGSVCLSEFERKTLRLFSIRRFSELPHLQRYESKNRN